MIPHRDSTNGKGFDPARIQTHQVRRGISPHDGAQLLIRHNLCDHALVQPLLYRPAVAAGLLGPFRVA